MNNKKYDLIVAGAGFSGVAAALSAARAGLKVLLFDKRNCCGGAAAGNLVNPFMMYWTTNPETKKKLYLSRGIFEELVDELNKYNAMKNYAVVTDGKGFSEEYLKLIMNRKLLEANVDLLFNSYLSNSYMEDGKIKHITVVSKSGSLDFKADFFIDATGDADLAVMSGYPYRLGRKEDGLCQPMTLCFRLGNVNMELFALEYKDIQKLYREYQAAGKIKNIREDVLTFTVPAKNVVHFNSTRIVKHNPVDAFDVTKAEIQAREQVFELYFFLKENFKSFENSDLLMTAQEIGVRESRMIDGEYILTQEDLKACTKFEDSIAACNYDIDIHNPEGTGTSHYYFKPGEYYTIPYRCLIPKNSLNLLVTGRCISCTHEAQASCRIMPTCCCLGEAAGLAIAIASKDGKNVKEIDVSKLREALIKNGAMI